MRCISDGVFFAHLYDEYITIYNDGEQYTLSYGALVCATAPFSEELATYLRGVCIPEISQHLPAQTIESICEDLGELILLSKKEATMAK